MLVFIDESGDPGTKLDGGSSRYYAVSALVFPSSDAASVANKILKEVKVSLKMPEQYEFKYAKIRTKTKNLLLQRITMLNCSIYAACIDKRVKTEPEIQTKAIEKVCKFIKEPIEKVCIDGSLPKQMQLKLKTSLNKSGLHIRKLYFQDSAREPLLQLADICVGAISEMLFSKIEVDKEILTLFKKTIKNTLPLS